MRGLRGQGGFEGAVLLVVSIFILAILGFALVGPLANSGAYAMSGGANASQTNNVSSEARTILGISPTLFVLLILSILLAGMGAAYFAFRGG